MKKIISVLTLAAILVVFSSSLHAKDFKAPHKVMAAFNFFKFADELQLTDEQLIQLRGFYKKHCTKPEKKVENPSMPSSEALFYMNEEQMKKLAAEESQKVHDKMMATFQKIIDIKKILTDEQLKQIKTLCEEEAKMAAEKKAIPEKMKKFPEKVKFNKPGFFKDARKNPKFFQHKFQKSGCCFSMPFPERNHGYCHKFRCCNPMPFPPDMMANHHCFHSHHKPTFAPHQGISPMPPRQHGMEKPKLPFPQFLFKLLGCQKDKKDDRLDKKRETPKSFPSENHFGSLKNKECELPPPFPEKITEGKK